MPNSKKAVALVVGITVAGLMGAFLVPVVLGQFSGGETATYNQSVGETVTLQPDLNATLNASTADTSAEYIINASGDTSTVTVSEGANSTVTVDGVDVTIALQDASASNATTEYTYPGTYGWGGGAGAIWAIIPVLIVLALFLFFVGMALNEV